MAGERLVHAYADGASRGNPGPAGCGAYVTTPEGRLLGEGRRALGDATSNAAEYAAAALALELAVRHRATAVTLHMDSRLVVEQLTRALGLGVGWATREPAFLPTQARIAALVASFDAVRLRWVPRARNARADRLANEAVDAGASRRPEETRDGYL
jgi:ribonuclease H / adenosylcobalamin/alpha-ribazole phosphatase